jgi:hypothetical protein
MSRYLGGIFDELIYCIDTGRVIEEVVYEGLTGFWG